MSSPTSTSSDSFHSLSRASSPPTPLSPHSQNVKTSPDYVFVADPCHLKHAAPLFPSGQKILVCLRMHSPADFVSDTSSELTSFIADSLAKMGEAMDDPRLGQVQMWSTSAIEVEGKISQFCELSASPIECRGEDVKFVDPFVGGQTFTRASALSLFSSTSLRVIFSVPSTIDKAPYTLYLLERAPFVFPPLRATEPFGVPTLEDWKLLWRAWDAVTLGMIPCDLLHNKPIDLRHKCLFYIGHIPTFLDMLLSALFREPHTEPENFTRIFERGIDPHVDDPEYCHNHSEVPEKDEDWPSLLSVLAFRDRVRARLDRVYADVASGEKLLGRRVGRTLCMAYEHEGFHIETILYMLIQRSGTGMLPPPGFTPPPFPALAAQWSTHSPPTSPCVSFPETTLVMGHDDDEPDDLLAGAKAGIDGHEFGWDNESPRREVAVGAFTIDWRPVTNAEYRAAWESGAVELGVPASWVVEDGEIKVRTLYGPVPFPTASQWPVLASYDDLAQYARSKGGRMPTEPELRLFFNTYDVGHAGGGNIGFRNWHPVPATAGGALDGGRGSNGGVWEWTSDLFAAHPGFSGTTIFPGYSSDFFDGKHHVVLGASYATIPRLTRRTSRNFYQHNYPYAWVGGRVAYDV